MASICLGLNLLAQQPAAETTPLETICAIDATAGSPTERTILIAALARNGHTTVLRPLSRTELDADLSAISRNGEPPDRTCASSIRPVEMRVWLNSSAPHADRDGAVWQGRGLTASVSGGVVVRRSVVMLSIRPLLAIAQNAPFNPAFATNSGDYRDPVWKAEIDLPYRFGGRPYGLIDPGESYVRVDIRGFSAGFSAASQHWGPAHFYPLVLGTEGAGYPRLFAEARQKDIGIGKATAQWTFGVLEASPFSQLAPGQRSRIASGFMAAFQPTFFRSLRLGGTRLFHLRRTKGALNWSNATFPFSGVLKNKTRDTWAGGANQLGSVFFQLSPASQVELYGEFYRDDHNVDLRDLFLEPDHDSGWTFGVRKAWISSDKTTAITVEKSNGRITHLARFRTQAPLYVHSSIAEGHTFRGQPLGSSALLAGGGLVASVSRISTTRASDLSFEIRPQAQNTEGGTLDGQSPAELALSFGYSRPGLRSVNASTTMSVGRGARNRSNVTIGVVRQFNFGR